MQPVPVSPTTDRLLRILGAVVVLLALALGGLTIAYLLLWDANRDTNERADLLVETSLVQAVALCREAEADAEERGIDLEELALESEFRRYVIALGNGDAAGQRRSLDALQAQEVANALNPPPPPQRVSTCPTVDELRDDAQRTGTITIDPEALASLTQEVATRP